MYWTPPFQICRHSETNVLDPPPFQTIEPPLLISDDLFFRESRDIGPPPFKNPGHAPDHKKDCQMVQVHHPDRGYRYLKEDC